MVGGLYNPRPVDDTPVNGQLEHGVTSNWAFDHAADLDAHTRNPFETLRVGEYHIPFGNLQASSNNMTADRLAAIPIIIARSMTWDRIACRITGADAGKVARMGIYEDGTNHYPGALVVDGGEISVAVNGTIAANINQQLTKGIYWLAILSDGTAGLRRPQQLISWILGILSTDFAYANSGWYVNQAYGALPDPFTAAGTLDNNSAQLLFAIALRLASLD